MTYEPSDITDLSKSAVQFGPGVFFSFIPDRVSGEFLDDWSPELIYIAGRSAQDFSRSATTFRSFDLDGVPAYCGVNKEGRGFMLIEVTEASWSACTPVTTVH